MRWLAGLPAPDCPVPHHERAGPEPGWLRHLGRARRLGSCRTVSKPTRAASAPIRSPGPLWRAQQAVVGPPGDAVALTGGGLEAGAVGDLHPAPLVADEARLLELARRDGDPGASHPEHHGEELVGHRELVPLDPVVRHQQPAREALISLVPAVA